MLCLQVIIHAKEMEAHGIRRFNFTDHLRNDLEFGPIFSKKFLKGKEQITQNVILVVCACTEYRY